MNAVMGALRRVWRVACAVARFAARHSPKWLVPVLPVCLAIPGPLDEAVVLAFVLAPVLRSRENRADLAASVRDAWKGCPIGASKASPSPVHGSASETRGGHARARHQRGGADSTQSRPTN